MNLQMKIAIILLMVTAPCDRLLADVVVPIESVDSFVNIRFAPDAASEVVGQLQQGSYLQHLRTVDGWYEVGLDGGGMGYVSADWSRVIGEDEIVVADATSEQAQQDTDSTAPDEPASTEHDEAVAEPADADEHAAAEPAADESLTETAIATETTKAATVKTEPAIEAAAEPAVEPVTEQAAPEAESESAPATGPDLAIAADVIGDESVEQPAIESDAVSEESAVMQTPDTIESAEEPVTVPMDAVPAEQPAATASDSASIDGSVDYLVKFISPNEGGTSQVFDNGRNVGIGTAEPQQRLEVNGNIQIHERNSNVAGLMITQSSGDTGYIMHNRANTLTIGAGSVDRITITRDGNVGFGVNRPSHPFEMASGAHVTQGGVWTNSSSIEKKENVRDLTPEEALAALVALEPVRFNYKADKSEDYVGFIAEDVPELVATSDRTGLSAMDIVAVLTSVVQQQQKKIDALEARLDQQAAGD